MTDPAVERRHHRRYSADFTVFHVGSNTSGRAYTRDISEGGAFLETRDHFEPGTRLDIEVFLDLGDEVCSMCAEAEVVWCSPQKPGERNGMGIRFVSMDEAARGDLRRAIARMARSLLEDNGG